MKQYFYENMEAVPIDLCKQIIKDCETLEWMPALLNSQTYHDKRNCFINDTAMNGESVERSQAATPALQSLKVIMNTGRGSDGVWSYGVARADIIRFTVYKRLKKSALKKSQKKMG